MVTLSVVKVLSVVIIAYKLNELFLLLLLILLQTVLQYHKKAKNLTVTGSLLV